MDDSLNAPEKSPLDPASYLSLPSPYCPSFPIPFHQSSFLFTSANLSMDLQFILSPVEGWSSQPPRSNVVPSVAPRYTHTKLHSAPKHVHPNPDDAIVSFDSTTRTFVKPSKPSKPPAADPYAEGFLRDVLGHDKWETFSSRLFERRLGTKPKGKGKGKPSEEEDVKSVSAIEFLVKVEVVKEILRTYVPHPYNPLKSLTHSYKGAPSGQVTLTRSTVLALSGWSNTQFSYWARRAEAVSVLAEYDPRLRAVGNILERRLRGDTTINDENQDEAMSVTGKGLDLIIDEVKKRTGKSQFLRGKHSSLDPYGTVITESEPASQMPTSTLFAMPTFQAEHYDHHTARLLKTPITPSLGPSPPPPTGPKRSPLSWPSFTQDPFDSQGESEEPATPSAVSSPCLSSDRALSPEPSDIPTSSCGVCPSQHILSAVCDGSTPHFPISDSRSEFESSNAGGKRKTRASMAAAHKRARTLLTDCED